MRAEVSELLCVFCAISRERRTLHHSRFIIRIVDSACSFIIGSVQAYRPTSRRVVRCERCKQVSKTAWLQAPTGVSTLCTNGLGAPTGRLLFDNFNLRLKLFGHLLMAHARPRQRRIGSSTTERVVHALPAACDGADRSTGGLRCDAVSRLLPRRRGDALARLCGERDR